MNEIQSVVKGRTEWKRVEEGGYDEIKVEIYYQ